MIELNLDLSQYHSNLILSKDEKHLFVWDPIRRKKIVMQPEEMVRQLLLQYFIENKFPLSRIAVEKSFVINQLTKRFDVVIFDKNANPFLLVECKSHTIPINQKTIDQLLSYNVALNASYQMVTNGINTYCFKVDYKKQQLVAMNKVPIINS